MVSGDITGNIHHLMFDGNNSFYPDIVHVHGDVYAVAYGRSYLKTFNISKSGTISALSTLQFDTDMDIQPSITHVYGSVYAVAYHRSTGMLGRVKSFVISNDGLSISEGASYDYIPSNSCSYLVYILHIQGNVCAIFYSGPSHDGWIKTVNISSSNITGIASHEYGTYNGWYPAVVHIHDDVYAVSYSVSTGETSRITTLHISDDGSSMSNIHTVSLGGNKYSDIIHVSGNVYALIYGIRSGANAEIWGATIHISADGTAIYFIAYRRLTATGREPSITCVCNGVYAIAYSGLNEDGWIKTVGIPDDGTSITDISTYEYDGWNARYPDILHVHECVYAIAYTGGWRRGMIRTLGIETPSEGTVARPPRFTGGMCHRGMH